MKRDSPKQTLISAAFGLIPVIWLGLTAAPVIGGGRGLAGRLPEIIAQLTAALNSPLKISLCGDSLKTVLLFVAAYAMGIGIYLSARRNTRPREEHGSAKWGEAAAVNKKYADCHFTENKILTQNVNIGFDAHKHRRNLNVLICGGSGAGKTKFCAKPTLYSFALLFLVFRFKCP
jgi:type IV secretion system protein VirD4